MSFRTATHIKKIISEAPSFSAGLKDCWFQYYVTGDIKWGKFVGVDEFGNKYYENDEDFPVGRNRWVIYKDYGKGLIAEPSTIPPIWFGWIHHMTDKNPTNYKFHTPDYVKPPLPNPTFTNEYYSYPKQQREMDPEFSKHRT